MSTRLGSIMAALAVVAAVQLHGQSQQPPVQIPQPGVPQIMTLEGKFVRVAYNNEGYAILGYQVANRSIGEPWMLLDFGTTLMENVKDYKLTRDAISLEVPDGSTIPLPSIEEYRKNANAVQSQQMRQRAQRDSINYFPPWTHQPCRLGFFSDLEDRAMPWDEVELDPQRACLGRLYFPVPGGIQYGQYWVNVKFSQSVVRVPFRILTQDEEKKLSKNYGNIKKQVDAAFRKKK